MRIIRAGLRNALEIAAYSSEALDRQLLSPVELWIATASEEALLLGAFQRADASLESEVLLRRGSGGPEVWVGPGTLHVALSLEHPAVLISSDEKRIVNRYVRPLLRALTRTGAGAHYFGRDWISVGGRPAGWVGFAHDASTRRTLFEAFVSLTSPFARRSCPSFRGKAPTTLTSVAGYEVDPGRVAETVADSYLNAYDVEWIEAQPVDAVGGRLGTGGARIVQVERDPPWIATSEEAIGLVGAGPDAHGVFRVGGDFLASRDALRALEVRAALSSVEALGQVVNETLGASGVALDGVRSLESFCDVIRQARFSPKSARS